MVSFVNLSTLHLQRVYYKRHRPKDVEYMYNKHLKLASSSPATSDLSEPHANNSATAASTSSATMNNGNKDTSNTDVQKLQEQLNDIKEQVSVNVNPCLHGVVSQILYG